MVGKSIDEPSRLVTGTFGIALVMAVFAGVGLAGSAAAHTCSQQTHDIEDHGGCNPHSCPEDTAPHDHSVDHSGGLAVIVHKCIATSNPPAEVSVRCDYANAGGDAFIAQNGIGGCVTDGLAGSFVTITIADELVVPASGLACWGSCAAASVPFCGATQTAATSDQLLVFLDGPAFGNPVLSPCGQASLATTGTIHVQGVF